MIPQSLFFSGEVGLFSLDGRGKIRYIYFNE